MLTDLKTIASHYVQVKTDIASVSLAKRASEMVMARLIKSKTPNLDLSRVKPIPRFLIPRPPSRPHSPVEDAAMEPTDETRDKYADNDLFPDAEHPLLTFEDAINASLREIASDHGDLSHTTGECSTSRSNSTRANDRFAPGAGEFGQAPRMATVSMPRVFPQSMLQASTTIFPVHVEDISRRYHQSRMARQEFAAAGGLPQNDYRFPQAHVVRI